MFHQELFERLIRKHPEAVMVQATMEQALPPSFVDEVFERTATAQYTRRLPFSTIVRLLSFVVSRVRSAVHTAIQVMEGEPRVTTKSDHNKLNGTEPVVAAALVQESARRMAAVVDELAAPAWQTRILDGSHLTATGHRPRALRTIGNPGRRVVTSVTCYPAPDN